MALPSLSKTWQYNVNNVVTSSGSDTTDFRALLLGIKNAMIGFASNPWIVQYSCNSSVAGSAGDLVDRWAAGTDLVWATGASAKSWIVLKQAGIATNFQICIELRSNQTTNEQIMALTVSPNAGFTGGTTTARPTAADEFQVLNGGSTAFWMSSHTSTFSATYHVQQSSDGACTRWFIGYQGRIQSFVFFEKATDAVTGWTYPFAVGACAVVSATTGEGPTYSNFNDNAGVVATPAGGAFGYHSGGMGLFLSTEGYVAGMLGEKLNVVANEISSEWPMCPIGLVSETVGKRGRHGALSDMWFGVNINQSGTTYPADGSRQFLQLRDIVIPWNGTVPVLS